MTQGSSATKGDVMVLLGTRKWAFILSSGKSRKNWQVSGPHSPGVRYFTCHTTIGKVGPCSRRSTT